MGKSCQSPLPVLGLQACHVGEALPLLQDGGWLYSGDVAFETRTELERCKVLAGDEWDDEEVYFVADELAEAKKGAVNR